MIPPLWFNPVSRMRISAKAGYCTELDAMRSSTVAGRYQDLPRGLDSVRDWIRKSEEISVEVKLKIDELSPQLIAVDPD